MASFMSRFLAPSPGAHEVGPHCFKNLHALPHYGEGEYFTMLVNQLIFPYKVFHHSGGMSEPSVLACLHAVTGDSQVAPVMKNLPANTGHVRDAGLTPGSGRSPGGGNGNPLQHSCLENHMDIGAWGLQSMVYQGVAHD